MKKIASAFLLITAILATPAPAQVTAHIWDADTTWYYKQIRAYLPDRIAPLCTVRNDGSDTAYQVTISCESQAYLRFADGSASFSSLVATRLAPGDSLHFPLGLLLKDATASAQPHLPWPQQVLWLLRWEQGSGHLPRSAEGHGIALIESDCPGTGRNSGLKGLEIVIPDTLVLEPGADGRQRHELEIVCLVYSREGVPITVQGVELKNDWYEGYIALPEINRLTPLDSILNRVIAAGDTLRVRFQVFVPYMEWRHHVSFTATATCRGQPECASTINLVERTQSMWLRHFPTQAAIGEMWITYMHPGGVDIMLQTAAWCGETPMNIDSGQVTLKDNGEAILPEHFKPSRFGIERRPLRAVFALDVTRSVGESGLARYRESIRAWSRMMDPSVDSLAIFTLADDVEQLLPLSADRTRIDEALSRLSLRDGHYVTGAAHALLDHAPGPSPTADRILLFLTDGWYASAATDADSLMKRADREGWKYHHLVSDLDVNLDCLRTRTGHVLASGDSLEMRRLYIEHQRQYDGFEFCRFFYTLPCRLGVERQLDLALKGSCGLDTTMRFFLTVPDDMLGDKRMRFMLRDATAAGGASVEIPVRYENARTQQYYTTEFALRYDTLRLRYDSLYSRSAGHLVTAAPGLISAVSGFWADHSEDDFAYVCFSLLPVSDTTQTTLQLEAWDTNGACSLLPSKDAKITILPKTTDVATETGPGDFRLLSVFPLPATDRITLELESDADAQFDYHLVDAIGREWLRGRLPAGGAGRWYHTIALPSDIPDGFYLLEIRQGKARRTATVLLRRR